MTDQAHEELEYRGNAYTLYGAPLLPFLESNKHIQFDTNWSTAHWCGYQGCWLLKDDCLYLKQIESANYSLEGIFNTNDPVLADWYTGTLQFSINNDTSYTNDIYDNHIWLKIEEGKVIEKKVIRYLKYEPLLKFGKYKGRSIRDLIYGKITYNTYTTIKNFIECLTNFLTYGEYNLKVQCPFFNIEKQDIDFIKEIHSCFSRIEIFIAQTYVVVSSKSFFENSVKDEDAEELSQLLEKILTSDFGRKLILKNDRLDDNADIAENTILINPDISYLVWAIKNVKGFSVSPIYLDQKFRIRKLRNFKTNRLNKTIFEYEPLIDIVEYTFPKEIQRINEKKFEKTHNLKFERNNKIQFLNYSDDEIMNLYGYYFNDNYQKMEFNHRPIKHVVCDDYDPDDWLIDAAGSDDPEMMNDAYWNLD